MSRAVYKTLGIEFLDRFYSDSERLRDAFTQAERLMDDPANDELSKTTETLTREGRLPEGTPGDVNNWLPLVGGDVADPVVRHGYRFAIQLARQDRDGNDRKNPLPIETFFVLDASDSFELHVCQAERQVTVAMFLPPYDRHYGSERATSRSWVVRRGLPAEPGAVPLDEGVVRIQRSGKPETRS